MPNTITITIKSLDDEGDAPDYLKLRTQLYKSGLTLLSSEPGDSIALLARIRREIGERAWCGLNGLEYTPNPFNDAEPSNSFLNLLNRVE